MQTGTRNQEAVRVKQYVSMFEKDIVAAGRDKAMTALSQGEEAKCVHKLTHHILGLF